MYHTDCIYGCLNKCISSINLNFEILCRRKGCPVQSMAVSSPSRPAYQLAPVFAPDWQVYVSAFCPTTESLCTEAAAEPQISAAHLEVCTLWSHSLLGGR